MIVRESKQWVLCLDKVKYTQYGETIEQWALPNKQWWLDFEKKWDHTKIIGFTNIELTSVQLDRFEEIKEMPEDFMELYTVYILNGDTSNDIQLPANHPFNIIRLRKNNEEIQLSLSLSMMETYNVLGSISAQQSLDQSTMMMEILTIINNLQSQGGNTNE